MKPWFFIGLAAVLAGCHKGKGPVVARVGTETITQADLEARLREAPEMLQRRALTPEGKKQFIDLLVREKLLLIEARREGLQRQKAYKEAVAEFRAQQALRQEEYEQTLLVESFLRRLRSKELAVTDADVQQYFDAHKAEFEKPIEIEVRHILVREATDAEAVLERLRRGEVFEKIAQEVSKDPGSAAQGGKIGPFARGQTDPVFEEAAFALKISQISAPIKTRFGFHIIKKTSEKALPPQKLADVKERLRLRLERDKLETWIARKQTERGVQIMGEQP